MSHSILRLLRYISLSCHTLQLLASGNTVASPIRTMAGLQVYGDTTYTRPTALQQMVDRGRNTSAKFMSSLTGTGEVLME
ncbi:hypothetical protein GDO81_023988 [Engystomops pustulosus]|uniref:Secreted protein n=1 Tax=Engystomops pustulosus TaxID=76066 RepID=A0AAV6YR90_ENGPU|nr:hypothetical protein GDO81_023988 [Engystomops pustulosus]